MNGDVDVHLDVFTDVCTLYFLTLQSVSQDDNNIAKIHKGVPIRSHTQAHYVLCKVV